MNILLIDKNHDDWIYCKREFEKETGIELFIPEVHHGCFVINDIDMGNIGAIQFRYILQQEKWAMNWAWLKKEQRGRGFFSSAIPLFRNIFDDFHFDRPLTDIVNHVVKKHCPWDMGQEY